MDHQDGNLTALYIAEEATRNVLPGAPVWYEQEPNSYNDFGGNYGMTTRKPITHDRQHAAGDVADNNPSAGFTSDLTPNNMQRAFQGVLYADAREKPSTVPLNAAAIVLTAVDGAAKRFQAAAGLGVFKVGHLVLAEGFTNAVNNGLFPITAVAAGALTSAGAALVAEAAPPAGARVTAVGFVFGAGDLTLTVSASRVILGTTAQDFTTMGLTLGEWIGVGGDVAGSRFADAGNGAPFYGRISAITATALELDKTTGTQVTDAGAGKTMRIFFGTVIRNEDDCTKIKVRTFTMERQYGCSGAIVEADYVTGAQANQATITVPTPAPDAKVTIDVTYIGGTSFERTNAEGLLAGTRVAALNEACFKPGLDVYRHRMAIIDETTLNPTALVSYNSQASLVVNNNVSGIKAIETFGNSGASVGEFTVTGSVTAYWTTVLPSRATRKGYKATWDLILTKNNAAIIFDVASVGLGNGRAAVAANTPVTLPLDTSAGKGKFGYTLLTTFLRYVPTVLMAQGNP